MTLADLGSFRPYSATHGLVVLAVAALTAAAVSVRRRHRDAPQGPGARRVDRVIAVVCFAAWLAYRVFKFMPGRYEASKALPLQVCDLVGLVAPLALWFGWRPWRTVLYFWGLGLSTQGFIQPDLNEGPADPSFWFFWTSHAAIVVAALYDVLARGFRPTWRDYGVAAAALTGYLLVVLPFDIVTGFNYGYVGNGTPGQPTVVDVLGTWPWRVAVICALVAAALALLVLPWDIVRRLRESPPRGEVLRNQC